MTKKSEKSSCGRTDSQEEAAVEKHKCDEAAKKQGSGTAEAAVVVTPSCPKLDPSSVSSSSSSGESSSSRQGGTSGSQQGVKKYPLKDGEAGSLQSPEPAISGAVAQKLPTKKTGPGRRKAPPAPQSGSISSASQTRERKKKNEPVKSMKITDFFPVRRSGRKTESEIKKEKADVVTKAILSENQDGLKIVECPKKGRGVVATKAFERGEFVVEYKLYEKLLKGEMVSREEGKRRNEEYAKDETIGSYLYYFQSTSGQHCVDATAESKYLGRLINHSAKKPNLKTKVVEIGKDPYLILIAAKSIKTGEELLYDYGERDSDAVASNPWLKDS